MGQDKNLGISESGKLFYFSGKQLTNQVFQLNNPSYAKLPQYPLVSRFLGQKSKTWVGEGHMTSLARPWKREQPTLVAHQGIKN